MEGGAVAHDIEMFGTHAGNHLPAGREVAIKRQRAGAIGQDDRIARFGDMAGQEIHRRRADKAGDKAVDWPVIEIERAPLLLDNAVAHDHDPVGHGHGLDLVMRHIDRSGAEPVMQRADFLAHLHAQRGVEVAQRFVEQKGLGIADDGAAHGHALSLSAR